MIADVRKLHVVVAEDEPLQLKDIAAKVDQSAAGFRTVGTAYNGVDALTEIGRTMPDLLITDIHMPQMNGLALLREVTQRYPDVRIIVLSGYDEFEYAKEAIRCGVSDYLLKPLDKDRLGETLQRMRRLIVEEKDRKMKDMLTAAVMGGDGQAAGLPQVGSVRARYRIYLVQIGHLTGPYSSNELRRLHGNLWGAAQPDEAAALLDDSLDWWWIDSPYHRGKFLVVRSEAEAVMPALQVGIRPVFDHLKVRAAPFPVTVLSVGRLLAFDELGEVARILNEEVEKRLRIGESMLIDGADKVDASSSAVANRGGSGLDDSLRQTVAILAQGGQWYALTEEIERLFDRWESHRLAQREVERYLVELLRLLHQVNALDTEEEIWHGEQELLKLVQLSPDFPAIRSGALTWLRPMLLTEAESEESQQPREIATQVERYLLQHYASAISIEELSARFHFSASYLTKVFKKHIGVSPVKYVISLRIREAKRLIADRPELSFKEIGAIVGYPDPNYFSRIFRNVTGLSLSEYGDEERSKLLRFPHIGPDGKRGEDRDDRRRADQGDPQI